MTPLPREERNWITATGYLRGITWICGDQAVVDVLERDHKQVYDTRIGCRTFRN